MIKRTLLLAATLMLPIFASGTAQASTVSIEGGITTLEVVAPLGALGLTGAPTGTASADGAVFSFPITGGSVFSNGNALIEHEGVGVTLSNAMGTEATVGDFRIDTAMASILGTVNGGTDFVPLFELGAADARGIEVTIGETLAGALTSIFGAPDLNGATFGFANVTPEISEVPLPASALLLLAGFGAMAGLRARKKAV